jgi:hypothetical protein
MWSTVHGNLIEEIARQLVPKLRPKYLALTNQRVIVATPDVLEFGGNTSRLPDVGVFSGMRDGPIVVGESSSAPLVLDALLPESLEQTFVEIRNAAGRQLVAAIEVLSITNKRGDGLEEFQKKRRELMGGKSHYVEIDLLRLGVRFPVAGVLPSVPYFAFLSRANRRPRLDIWPILLEGPLPKINVPLLDGDPDVTLDLQQAFQTIYDLYGYDQTVDYTRPPAVPLSTEQMAWVSERLKA